MTEEIERQIGEPTAEPEPTSTRRFPILMSPLWRPLLLPFGATADRAFVDVEDGEMHVRFGFLFDHRFPLDQVEGVAHSHWPLWAGIGWRTNFRGNIGLIGTYVNIVEVRFKEAERVRMLLPLPCRRLYLSVEEPQAFIAALGRQLRAAEGQPPSLPRRRRAKAA